MSRKYVYSVNMLTEQRKTLLLNRLASDGRIIAKELAQELGLSDDTIRRDLRELASKGFLQRVHGGAMPCAPAEADFVARQQIASDSKQCVGKVAAGLIRSNSVVILDGGTTTLQIVRHLPLDLSCTVVSHSPSIAIALANHIHVTVIMIGGVLFRHSMVGVGAGAIESISHIRADCYFMGVTGVSIDEGLSTGDLEEAHVKRALCGRAAETIILASEEKLNVASPYVVMPLVEATGIVLDGATNAQMVRAFKRVGLDVHVG